MSNSEFGLNFERDKNKTTEIFIYYLIVTNIKMDLAKQQELEQTHLQAKRKVLPIRILAEAVKFGAGFYVGLMDGQGTPVDPATRYTFLATPSVLSGAFSAASCYGIQKLVKHTLETDKSGIEEKLNGIPEDKREDVQELLYKLAYTNLTPKMPKLVAKSTGTTALKTGIGYAVGYGLAKLL
jgi:hypothetical protein